MLFLIFLVFLVFLICLVFLVFLVCLIFLVFLVFPLGILGIFDIFCISSRFLVFTYSHVHRKYFYFFLIFLCINNTEKYTRSQRWFLILYINGTERHKMKHQQEIVGPKCEVPRRVELYILGLMALVRLFTSCKGQNHTMICIWGFLRIASFVVHGTRFCPMQSSERRRLIVTRSFCKVQNGSIELLC